MRRKIIFVMALSVLTLTLSLHARAETSSASSVRVLHDFFVNESVPSGPGMIKASDGGFYGTWFQHESTFDFGGVFRLDPSGAFRVVYVFPRNNNGGGNGPWGSLAQGLDGNLYGTTAFGGVKNAGVAYRVTPSGGVFTLLHSFGTIAIDGANPQGGLTRGSDGNFYGTTPLGGKNNVGAVFRITPLGVVTILHSFSLNQTPTGGARPIAGLIEGRDGWLYGTTVFNQDSTNDFGTIFRVSPAGLFNVVHRFHPPGGYSPQAALVQTSDGSFYGTTYFGGAGGAGTVFRLTPTGNVMVLHAFRFPMGAHPFNALVQTRNGLFYSTVGGCSQNQADCAYRISSSGKFEILHVLSFAEGTALNGFVVGNDGFLYGDAQGGGIRQGGWGTAFRLTP
jgi:uncharacterized repeat protein (TIGR03803 family)